MCGSSFAASYCCCAARHRCAGTARRTVPQRPPHRRTVTQDGIVTLMIIMSNVRHCANVTVNRHSSRPGAGRSTVTDIRIEYSADAAHRGTGTLPHLQNIMIPLFANVGVRVGGTDILVRAR